MREILQADTDSAGEQQVRIQRPMPIGVSVDSARRQLEQILASRAFATAAQLSRFLRFIVERALQDSATSLTEQQIGTEAFGKPESFDPRVDPIVRVQASRMRAKLRTYYATEGAQDRLIIDLPPRCYFPVISSFASGTVSVTPRMDPHSCSRSIAVLPLSGVGKWSESFNQGFTDELIHAMTERNGLQVLAWHAGAPSDPKASNVREIARRLSVDTMLEGSSRRSHNMVRVCLRLIKVQDGSVLWSHVYASCIKDVVNLQAEIAGKVAQAISIRTETSSSGRLAVLRGQTASA